MISTATEKADILRAKTYDSDMTMDELYKAHTRQPVQPFTICLGDRQRLPVLHPEMLAYAPKHRTAVVYRKDGSFEIIDLLLVKGLDVHAPMNGKRHKRSS